jgi:hypothetical protein
MRLKSFSTKKTNICIMISYDIMNFFNGNRETMMHR